MRPQTPIDDAMVERVHRAEYSQMIGLTPSQDAHTRRILEAALNGERRKGDRRAFSKLMGEIDKGLDAADRGLKGEPYGSNKEQGAYVGYVTHWPHRRIGDRPGSERFHSRPQDQVFVPPRRSTDTPTSGTGAAPTQAPQASRRDDAHTIPVSRAMRLIGGKVSQGEWLQTDHTFEDCAENVYRAMESQRIKDQAK